MVSPNTSYDDLLSTTIQELDKGGELFNQFATKCALVSLLKEHDCLEYPDGGPNLVTAIDYQTNGSYTRFADAGTLSTVSNQTFTAFVSNWKHIAINIQSFGAERLKNAGKSQRRNLVKSRLKNAKATWRENFNSDLLSDGTATNSLQVTGLQAHIADDPTTGTVQGISRSSWTFARNKRYRATTDGGAAASASNIVQNMDELDLLLMAVQANTKAILSDNTMFKYFEGTVHPLQRLNNEKGALGKLGFRTYQYKDAEVVFEPTDSGMPSATQYWIDPEALVLQIHADRDLVSLGTRQSYTQDAQIEYLGWMGNLCARTYRKLGVLNND